MLGAVGPILLPLKSTGFSYGHQQEQKKRQKKKMPQYAEVQQTCNRIKNILTSKIPSKADYKTEMELEIFFFLTLDLVEESQYFSILFLYHPSIRLLCCNPTYFMFFLDNFMQSSSTENSIQTVGLTLTQ